MYKNHPQKKYHARLCFVIAFFGQASLFITLITNRAVRGQLKVAKKIEKKQKKPLFCVWQSDTKCVGEVRNCVGEMKQSVGEMKQTVGETQRFVGEMKQI